MACSNVVWILTGWYPPQIIIWRCCCSLEKTNKQIKDKDKVTKSLAEILNVDGLDKHNDWGGKKRKPYWDDFIKDLNQNIGGWLYTEFNKRGIKIPALKLYKGSFIG